MREPRLISGSSRNLSRSERPLGWLARAALGFGSGGRRRFEGRRARVSLDFRVLDLFLATVARPGRREFESRRERLFVDLLERIRAQTRAVS